jgi:mono/diheme cytochrome c family protein
MFLRNRVLVPILAFSLSAAGAVLSAQTIKKEPAKHTSPTSGVEMYTAYCAACHGLSGKGDGPAAPALKATPTDLSMLTTHNNGKFPERMVYSAIKGDVNAPVSAHGSKDMPVWGTVLRSVSQSQEEVDLRLANLVNYVKGLQAKT